MSAARRLEASIVASALLHALVLGTVLRGGRVTLRPPYPLVARRLGKEGVVLLAVGVAPDGRAADVRVLRSSGFAPLDDSAVTTVRERWRFIPARRDGAPIESRVTVPIRFRLAGEAG